ncbi:hypothetical protein PHMEG_00024146 [Phytophthora megakarya]|uniref:Uncharacterized protein n=1 Tax=Phytophthora megakarya TaxID=4795 RepID=A0A225VHQ0_9STRA|nr:hypothetical protein PHMEG_00024146 [Phytophthora megakarya]
MKPVKSTIDRKLLEVICLYELRKAVENVSNSEIVQLIQQRIGTIPDLDELFKTRLKVDLDEDDIDARVLKYYQDSSTIIQNHGLGKILGVGDPDAEGFADRMNLRSTILIDSLEPRKVRDDVKHHCKYVCTGARKNDFMLFNIIKEKTRDQHKYLQLVLEQKVKTASVRKPDSSPPKRKSARADIRASNPRVSSPASIIVQTPRKVAAPPKTGCWHCQGQHWLRECPAEGDKARAVERMKELKEKR